MDKNLIKLYISLFILGISGFGLYVCSEKELINEHIGLGILLLIISMLGFINKIVFIKFPIITDEKASLFVNLLILIIGVAFIGFDIYIVRCFY